MRKYSRVRHKFVYGSEVGVEQTMATELML